MIKFNCTIEQKDQIIIEQGESSVKFEIDSQNGNSMVFIDNDQFEELKEYFRLL